ncbi:hypothetical protein [Pseudomonas sp. UBA1879]|uniref:hypothetical protein n=1 Tax=Pseudomonas sp. UBA1879 TaxID=1947305 RepID=UPI0025ED2C51|nr:hypothetical protein [Pseudomonas sp. UBA1879]
MRKINGFRASVLLLLVINLSACETMANAVPTIPDLIYSNKFKGGSVQAVYDKFGRPDKVIKTADGQSSASWFMEKQYSLTDTANTASAGPAGGVTLTPTSNTKYYDKKCTIIVTFDSKNIVTDYKTIKNSPGSCTQFGV